MYCWTRTYWGWPKALLDGLGTGKPSNCGAGDVIPWKSRSALIEKWMDNKSPPGCLVICCWPKCVLGHPWGICSEVASISALLHSSWKPPLLAAGSEEGAAEAKRALLGAVGKLTDVVSCLGFSWWQGGPPHTQALKDLHWVRARACSLRWCGVLFAQGLCFQIWPRPASPGDGGAALQHLRVLEGFLPLGERRLQLHLHLHHRCSGRTRFKVAPSQTCTREPLPCLLLCHRRGRWEAADAWDGIPDHRSRQLLGFLPGAAGGVPGGALQAQPGALVLLLPLRMKLFSNMKIEMKSSTCSTVFNT